MIKSKLREKVRGRGSCKGEGGKRDEEDEIVGNKVGVDPFDDVSASDNMQCYLGNLSGSGFHWPIPKPQSKANR